MHRPEPPARVAAVLAAALLLGAPSALGEDQPKPGEALGPSHVQLQLARSHQYSDRFAVQFVTASPDGREVAALARLSGSEPRAWDVRDGRTLELPPTSPETTVL